MRVNIVFRGFTLVVDTDKNNATRDVVVNGKPYSVVYTENSQPAIRGHMGRCVDKETREAVLAKLPELRVLARGNYFRVYCETYRRVTVNHLSSQRKYIAEPYVTPVTKGIVLIMGLIALALAAYTILDPSGVLLREFLS